MERADTGNSRYGIVFVHGIVGNNRIFDFLKPMVPGEYEAVDIVLEGHGGDALDFSRASMARWKAQVNECIDSLSARCDTVIAVGHSMGCLLLLDKSTGGSISRLFLMNPPMSIRPRPGLLINAVKVATGRTDNDPVAYAAKEAYGISLDLNPLHYYGWPARYIELFREIRRARLHVLPEVKCPVRVMLSRKDEMVSLSSGNVFKTLPSATVTELPSSTHYYYSPTDRTLITRQFNEFISST